METGVSSKPAMSTTISYLNWKRSPKSPTLEQSRANVALLWSNVGFRFQWEWEYRKGSTNICEFAWPYTIRILIAIINEYKQSTHHLSMHLVVCSLSHAPCRMYAPHDTFWVQVFEWIMGKIVKKWTLRPLISEITLCYFNNIWSLSFTVCGELRHNYMCFFVSTSSLAVA